MVHCWLSPVLSESVEKQSGNGRGGFCNDQDRIRANAVCFIYSHMGKHLGSALTLSFWEGASDANLAASSFDTIHGAPTYANHLSAPSYKKKRKLLVLQVESLHHVA